MALFQPKWKNKNLSIRIEWINEADTKKEKHINILEQIAHNDTEFMARKSAFEKLGDKKAALFEELIYAKKKVKLAVINKINDDLVLKDIVIESNKDVSEDIKLIAVKKIISIEVLKDVILNNSVKLVIKEEALQKIKDDSILRELGLNNKVDKQIALNAIEKIENQDVLINIFKDYNHKQDWREEYSNIALSKIKDQTFLENVVNDYKNHRVTRLVAINKLTNQDLLKKIAEENIVFDHYTSIIVIKRLLDLKAPADYTNNFIYEILNKYYTGHKNKEYGFDELLYDIILRIDDKSIFEKIVMSNKVPTYLGKIERFIFSTIKNNEIIGKLGITENCSKCKKAIDWEKSGALYCTKCQKIYCSKCTKIHRFKVFDDEEEEELCIECGSEFY